VKIRFGLCTLDLDTRQLRRNGREIHLTPKAYALLEILISERPKVVSKSDLQRRIWPDTFVVEANLSSLVAEVRTALGDRARDPRFIRTVHGFGYAFCANTTTDSAPRPAAAAFAAATVEAASAPKADSPSCWLEWGTRRFPLAEGDHVIGRDRRRDQTRCLHRLPASCPGHRHRRQRVARRLWQQERHVPRRDPRHVTGTTRRWRRHPDRIGASDVSCALAPDVDGDADDYLTVTRSKISTAARPGCL
jgi:DNA-binding winged helix-turn-helix (wHTH) protein